MPFVPQLTYYRARDIDIYFPNHILHVKLSAWFCDQGDSVDPQKKTSDANKEKECTSQILFQRGYMHETKKSTLSLFLPDKFVTLRALARSSSSLSVRSRLHHASARRCVALYVAPGNEQPCAAKSAGDERATGQATCHAHETLCVPSRGQGNPMLRRHSGTTMRK